MKTIKPLILLALVFLAGLAIGIVGTRSLVRHEVRQAMLHPEKTQQLMEERVDRRLHLDNDQEARLHDILAVAHLQIREARLQIRPQIELIASNTDQQISALLNPDQLTRYEKLKADNHPLLQFLRQPK